MNEELILAEVNEITQDNVDIIQDSLVAEASEVETGVAEFGGEGNDDMPMEETTVDVLYVGSVEEIEIEVDEAIGWVPGDPGRHYSLPDRNDPDQHIIESITGLREELDEIETLKTAYSDKVNVANYYKWEGGKAYDTYGYFVSLVPDSTEIEICKGSDILGVSVDAAGFVGGQDATVKRNNSYGLIATSGLVDVRCELEVNVGDYVVSNAQGYAKKAGSNFGYRVLATKDKNGITYAIIALGVQADVTNALGLELGEVKEQIDANYKNIISAVNVANQAYQKANEIETSNQEMSDKVDATVGKVDGMVTEVGDLSNQVANSATISAQAKAIAESAATSAASMKKEAVEAADNALAETSKLRDEYKARIAEIDTELDNTSLELQATKEEFNATINSLKLETEGQFADFEKEVSEKYATTQQLAAVKTETSDAIAVVKQEASDTYATIESVAALQTETSEAIAGFKQEVSETYATQEMLSTLETDTSKALTDYKQEVTETYATQEMVSKLETDTTKALTDYKQEVTNTYATQEVVSKLETDTTKALTDYKQEVSDNYATNTSLANLKTETTNAISASEEKATETYATKSDLTSFEGETNIAMARIEQKADANGAYIQSTVSNMDKYAVGPYSQAYGFTLTQAESVLEDGVLYVPTADVTETYDGSGSEQAYTRNFLKTYLYKWGVVDGKHRWITVDKFYNDTDITNTSAPAVYFQSNNAPAIAEGDKHGYWYTDGDTLSGTAVGYEPHTLYKWTTYTTKSNDGKSITESCWVAVATLAGNSQNRAVSQIRQDANSITLEVTSVKGDVSKITERVGESETEVSSLAAWRRGDASEAYSESIIRQTSSDNGASVTISAYQRDEDGEVEKEVSLVLNSTEDGSSLCFDADNINFTATADYSVLAENITLRADRLDFGGDGTEEIKLNADNIDFEGSQFSVSIQNSIDSAVDDIEVGGRNLLLNTKTLDGDNITGSFTKTKGNTYKDTQIAEGFTTDPDADVLIFNNLYPEKLGAVYTLSFFSKGVGYINTLVNTTSNAVKVAKSEQDTREVNTNSSGYCSWRLTDEWQHHWVTWTLADTGNINDAGKVIFRIYGGNTVELAAIKLEKGNKATDWTPAPEDMATTAELKVVNDKILTKVESSTYESGFTQLAGEISAKVSSRGNNDEGFGWSLDDDGFYLKQYADAMPEGKDVFSVDKNGNASMNSGHIAGWEITENSLAKGSVMLSASDDLTYRSLVTDNPSPIRINVGEIPVDGVRSVAYNDLQTQEYDTNSNGKIVFTIKADKTVTSATLADYGCSDPDYEDEMFGAATIEISNNIITLSISNPDPDENIGFGFVIEYVCDDAVSPNFCLLEDGSLYANNVKLSGGTIAGLKIEGNQLSSVSDEDGSGLIVSNSGIKVTGSNVAIQVGDGVSLSHNANTKDVILSANSHFSLTGTTGASLDVMRSMEDEYCNVIAQVYITDYDAVLPELRFEGGTPIKSDENSYMFKITSNKGKNEIFTVNYSIEIGGAYTISPESTAPSWYDTEGEYTIHVEMMGPNDTTWQPPTKKVVTGGTEWFTTIDKLVTETNSDWHLKGNFIPDGECCLGTGNNKWNALFANKVYADEVHADTNYYMAGTVFTSDLNKKNTIEPVDAKYSELFDKLNPVTFKLNEGTSGRTHMGLIAQEVKESMDDCGIDSQDFAAYCSWRDSSGNETCGIRYTEFISLCIDQIQKLKKRVEELENKLNTTQND